MGETETILKPKTKTERWLITTLQVGGIGAGQLLVCDEVGGGRLGCTGRVSSDCHFVVQLDHFLPGFLSYSVAAFLK